jgi:hypothetical protein
MPYKVAESPSKEWMLKVGPRAVKKPVKKTLDSPRLREPPLNKSQWFPVSYGLIGISLLILNWEAELPVEI